MKTDKPGGKIWNLLVSRNLAIWLLAVVTLLLAAGAFLPNPSLLTDQQRVEMQKEHPIAYWLGERYNSQKLAKGYFFGLIGVFLIISTTMCSIDRVFKWRKARARSGEIPLAPGQRKGVMVSLQSVMTVTEIAGKLKGWFRKRRMRVFEAEDMIVGYRGEAGFWGSIFFHAILITALVGLVIYYLGGYRASFNITEGQTLHLKRESFFYIEKEPLWGLPVPDVLISLDSVYTTYAPEDPWTAVDHVVKLKVKDLDTGKLSLEEMKINRPIKIDGKDFLLQSGGFSPRVIITNGEKTIFDSFVSLRNRGGREDDFGVEGIHVNITIYPDYYINNGEPDTRTPQLKNPFFGIELIGKEGRQRSIIPIGGTMQWGRYSIHIPDVRRWVILQMTGEPGIGFFFVISFVGILGVLLRFLDPDERIYVRFSGDGRLEVIPYSKYFSGLINERVEELVRFLENSMGEEKSVQGA